MKQLISLIKTNLNITYGISAFKYKYFKQKKELWQPIILIVALLSLIPTYILYIGMIQGLHTGLNMINQEGMLLLIGFLASQIIVFIFGIIYVLSKFYFSNDFELLIPLPIKASNIIISKFITLLVNEYLTILPILLPIFVIFAINSDGGIVYWLYSVLIFLTLPIIPLGISSILVMIFMKYTNIKGKRDMIRIIGFILMIAIIIGIQFGTQSLTTNIPRGQEQDYIANLLEENDGLIRKAGSTFPPSIWASLALSNVDSFKGFLSLLLFLGVSLLVFYVMIYLSERIYYKGLIGGQEVSTRKKKLTESELKEKTGNVNHPVISIFLREIKILLRTPIFLMNSVGAVIMIPIAMAIPVIMSGDILENLPDITDTRFMPIIILVVTGFIIFIGATNGVGSTTFSREGKQFWISRMIPVKVEHQIMGKILSALSIQLLGIAAVLGVGAFLIEINIIMVLGIVILGLLASIPIIELSMLIDILRPLLDWDNPQKAMKQNLNVLFSMALGVLYILLLVSLTLALIMVKISYLVIFLLLTVVFIGLSIGLFFLLSGTSIKRFRDIE